MSSNIVPFLTQTSHIIDRISDVFPLPDDPIRNTNSHGSILKEISFRMVLSLYDMATFLNSIFYLLRILIIKLFETVLKFPSVRVIFPV